jgi:hypothetical protein
MHDTNNIEKVKYILKKWNGRTGTEFIWLLIGTSGGKVYEDGNMRGIFGLGNDPQQGPG